MKDLRVGYAPIDFADRADAGARPAFAAALEALKTTGVQLVETRLPDFPFADILSTILYSEAGSIFETLITSGRVNELADQPQIAGLKASLEIPARDYLKAMRVRRLVQEAFARMFGTTNLRFRV